MHPASTVLVVVPDAELRRSIEFAFEAEGFLIEPHDCVQKAMLESSRSDVVCIVIDEDAIDLRRSAVKTLECAPKPLILLVDKLRAAAKGDEFRVLTKPLLGRLLVDTVADVARHIRPAT